MSDVSPVISTVSNITKYLLACWGWILEGGLHCTADILDADKRYCFNLFLKQQYHLRYLQINPLLPARLTSSYFHFSSTMLPARCLTVINRRQFQGSLPWWSAGAMWWQSVTDCRVMKCRDRERTGNQHAQVLSSWWFDPRSRWHGQPDLNCSWSIL